jgi:hypothetical protein
MWGGAKFCRATIFSGTDIRLEDCALGIMCREVSPGIGDICLFGVVELDFSEGANRDIQSPYESGKVLWLSTTPGQLTVTPPAIGRPVAMVLGYANDRARVFVCPVLDQYYRQKDTVVTSLEATSEGLQVTGTGAGAAKHGDVKVRLDLSDLSREDDADGYKVLKAVDGTTLHFGPVVESIQLNSASGAISDLDGNVINGKAQGNLLLSLGDSWDKFSLPVQSVHLDQMRESFIGNMSLISFFPNQKSGFSGNIYLPWFNGSKAEIKIRLTLVCGAKGRVRSEMFTGYYVMIPSYPCTDAPRLLLPSIPSLCSPLAPDNELEFNFDVSVAESYMYFTVCSEPIEVLPGAMVWFSAYQDPKNSEDFFPGALSVLRMEANIIKVVLEP